MRKKINIKKYMFLLSTIFCLSNVVPAFALDEVIGETDDDSQVEVVDEDLDDNFTNFNNKKIMMGYFHNFPCTDGYKGGVANNNLELKNVSEKFNVVCVSFMKSNKDYEIPTFKPEHPKALTPKEFKDQVLALNKKGVSVLISLGGANGHVILKNGQQNALRDEIIRLCDTYGFNGLDIDLEQSAITGGDNQKVIPEALKMVKDHYKKSGKNFIISMAPEFPYLQVGRKEYKPYIDALNGYYDFIAPQYYNQGGDGVWVDEISKWISQSDDKLKEEFLYYLTDSLINGKRNYIKIPADKLLIGLPANVDAAGSGYVIDQKAVYNAFARLEKNGTPIKGLMTWSINWDTGFNKDKKPYNSEFINRYSKLIYG